MAPIALGPDIGGRIPIVFERLSWRKRERKRQRCRLFCLAGIYSSSLAKCSLSFSVSLLSTVRRLRRSRQANTAQTACRPHMERPDISSQIKCILCSAQTHRPGRAAWSALQNREFPTFYWALFSEDPSVKSALFMSAKRFAEEPPEEEPPEEELLRNRILSVHFLHAIAEESNTRWRVTRTSYWRI